MADNQIMEELLQAPTDGYGKAIVIPKINAGHYEIKTNLLKLVQANQYHDTFYNGLNENDQDSLNVAAGGNLLSKTIREALNIIKNKSKVLYSRNKSNVSMMNTTSRENASKTDDRIDKLTDQISTLVDIVSKKVVTPATVKAVEESYVTCGGNHAYYNYDATNSNQLSVCAVTGTYNQVVPQNRASNHMAPPGFAPVQNSQNRYNQNQEQGNNFNRGNNFHGNQSFQIPNQRFQNQPFQVPNNKVQQGLPNEFSSYKKANDQMMRNMQNQINSLKGEFKNEIQKTMKTQQTVLMNKQNAFKNNLQNMLSGFFQNQASTLGTLLSNTIPNPKGEMKTITTRSGVAYERSSIPTNPSPKKVVERETKETTDKEQTNFQGSTAHIQPPVVPISEPDVPKTFLSQIFHIPRDLMIKSFMKNLRIKWRSSFKPFKICTSTFLRSPGFQTPIEMQILEPYWILEDKIICDLDKTPDLFQQPHQNCPECGNPVNGHYCQGCAFLRKKFKKDLFTSGIEHGILQDSFGPSNDNSNVANALREPFVVSQDPGNNYSQSPPQINNHCCYSCGDPLEGIFCHQCTCKLCGNGAHYGYNCPSKVPIIPDPEPFNNQTIKELPPTMQSFDPKSDLVHNSPNVFRPSLQFLIYSYEFCGNDAYYAQDYSLQVSGPHETCQCDQLIFDEPHCKNYGGPHENFQFQPMNQNFYEPNMCSNSISSDFDQFQTSQFLVIHQPPQETSIQEMEDLKKQYLDEMKRLINLEYRDEIKIDELKGNFNSMSIEINKKEKLQQLKQVANLSTFPSKRFNSFCYDDVDDKDYVIAVTPSLSTEEPDNSLSMGDEHLDTILVTESDEFVKSSVENLISILSEFEGIPDNMCDVPFHENSSPLDVSKDQFEHFSDSNDEFSSNDDDSFSIDNIEYVEASHLDSELVGLEVMEIVIPEVGGIDDDIHLTIKDDILREKLLNINLLIANIEALNDNPTPSFDFMTKSSSTSLNSLLEETNTFDNSLPEFETFCFDVEEISSGSTTTRSDICLLEYEAFYDDHIKEISSGSTTTHSDSSLYDSFIFDLSINPFPPADRSDFYEFTDELIHIISPPEYDCFFLKIEPDSGDFTIDVVEDISPTREPRVHNALPTHPTL
nr:hypothetical protein [Tanacetum cinerariifolium]